MNSLFEKASKEFELALSPIALIATGNVPPSSALMLLARLNSIPGEYWESVNKALPSLSRLSDGPVKWDHGRGLSGVARNPDVVLPHVWSSAHEAVLGIVRLALDLWLRPLEQCTDKRTAEKRFRKVVDEKTRTALAMSASEIAELQERMRRERAAYVETKPLNEKSKSSKRKPGRPTKDLKDGDELVIAALAAHHQYQSGGSIGNFEPAVLADLERINGNPKKSTFSKFMKRECNGYKGYCAACRTNKIGELITRWRNEERSREPGLRDDE